MRTETQNKIVHSTDVFLFINDHTLKPTSPHPEPATESSRTLRRGLAVLSVLQEAGVDGLNVTDLARRTGLQRATVYRLLEALLETGWVRPVAHTRRYGAVRTMATDPALRALDTDARVMHALPAMRRLVAKIKDALFLCVLDGDDSLTLHREIGSYPVQILPSYPGQRHPAGVGSAGLALLAALPEQTANAIIDRNAVRLLEYNGMSLPLLRRLIQNTRLRGYAVMGNLAAHGAIGVACTLTDATGYPILAISAAASIERMPSPRHRQIAELIRDELKGFPQVYQAGLAGAPSNTS